jgi:anti-sigma B factor antagonist
MIDSIKHDKYSILSMQFEELDFIKTPRVSAVIKEKLESIGYGNIILDINNLDYIDSTGMSSLINISRRIKDKNHEMVVVCSSTKILQLFDIAKMANFFRIFVSMEEAENYLQTRK